MPLFTQLSFEALSIDWKTPIGYVRAHLGDDMIIQGNLDPAMLYADKKKIEIAVANKISEVGRGHIFNLGHGVYPDTDATHVKHMIDTVKVYKY